MCIYFVWLHTVLTESLIYLSDIMKLTALFTAQWGWEGCNYQFDFLQPTHSLFGYFNPSWWVDQYTKIIQPNKETLEQLKSPMTSLQNFARICVNIFGTETDKEWRKCEEAMEKEKPKEREEVVWDGHTASKANTCNTFSTNINFNEQMLLFIMQKALAHKFSLFSSKLCL